MNADEAIQHRAKHTWQRSTLDPNQPRNDGQLQMFLYHCMDCGWPIRDGLTLCEHVFDKSSFVCQTTDPERHANCGEHHLRDGECRCSCHLGERP